ncbi:unnamed protein product [Arabis nemorensis]|uniref:KIB1-4 beta-propeller domain-containing protein n=1 Tax=Arabis nemorensis TaxID=586526 RepID=A0A565CIM5_9BRAS|nr:unnamed protein product [Arabis nemorensis]
MNPPLRIEKLTKPISDSKNISVTTSGDVLLVRSHASEDSTSPRHRIFRLFKRDPNQDPILDMDLVEVDSLGDEALSNKSCFLQPTSTVRNFRCAC